MKKERPIEIINVIMNYVKNIIIDCETEIYNETIHIVLTRAHTRKILQQKIIDYIEKNTHSLPISSASAMMFHTIDQDKIRQITQQLLNISDMMDRTCLDTTNITTYINSVKIEIDRYTCICKLSLSQN